MKYASQTSVAVDKSRAEIERTLERYGASQFAYAHNREAGIASIMFVSSGRHIRFTLHLPKSTERQFTHTSGKGLERSQRRMEQDCLESLKPELLTILNEIKNHFAARLDECPIEVI